MSSISVVMAVFNGQRFLRQQVESVLAELVPGDEFIAIDDGSSDGSLSLLNGIGAPVLRVLANPENLGVARTFERGLRLATNEYIFLCDQDDVWLPGKRAAFVSSFERDSSVMVVISDAEVIDEQGRVISSSFMATRRGFDGSLMGTLWRNRYLGCSMALRRCLLEIALPVPRLAPMHDMWIGMLGRIAGNVTYLPSSFLHYRRHSANVTPSRPQSWPRMLLWRIQLATALTLRVFSRRIGLNRGSRLR